MEGVCPGDASEGGVGLGVVVGVGEGERGEVEQLEG